MLGIIIALEEEINNLFSEYIKDYSIHYVKTKKFYIFKSISGENVVLTFSGVGKSNAAMTSSLLINNFNVELVINIGSCASINHFLVNNEILIVDKTLYGDVDATAFNYEINQIPQMPLIYEPDKNTKNQLVDILNLTNLQFKLGILYTLDSFINKQNYQRFNLSLDKNIPSGVDMEFCAIAQVCNQLNVKYASVKIVSDQIFANELDNVDQYNHNINKVANLIDQLIYNIIQVVSYKLAQNQ